MTIDGRSEATYKIVEDRFPSWHSLELIFLIIIEMNFSSLCFEPIFLKYSEGNKIDIGIEHWLEISFDPLNFDWLGSVDTHNFHSVSRTNAIHVVVVTDDCEGMGSFTLRYILRQFLELDILFVSKLAKIMNEFETILMFTISAICWLLNFGIL